MRTWALHSSDAEVIVQSTADNSSWKLFRMLSFSHKHLQSLMRMYPRAQLARVSFTVRCRTPRMLVVCVKHPPRHPRHPQLQHECAIPVTLSCHIPSLHRNLTVIQCREPQGRRAAPVQLNFEVHKPLSIFYTTCPAGNAPRRRGPSIRRTLRGTCGGGMGLGQGHVFAQ